MEKKWLERSERMARKFRVVVNGKEYIVEVEELGGSTVPQSPQPASVSVEKPLERPKEEKPKEQTKIVEQPKQATPKPSTATGGIEVKSPMSGLILKVHVSEGQQITRGQKLLVLEAMKWKTTSFLNVMEEFQRYW